MGESHVVVQEQARRILLDVGEFAIDEIAGRLQGTDGARAACAHVRGLTREISFGQNRRVLVHRR